MVTDQSCEVAMTDEELLDRFVSCRDAAAFESLVRRHGPMVLGVCRRILRNPQDAEDAFQATFLILVRKAASLSQRELLGNWLYGVAYRTALDARAAAIRRQKREKQVNAMPEPEIRDDSAEWRDLRPLLDRELNRLPDKYRIPVVLCDLDGMTRQEAAEKLDIPVGTLSGRLTTAREMLAKRLTRRGLTLSGGALVAALSPSAVSAAVPSPLVASTVQAAAAGAVSAQAAILAEGVMKAMLVKKLKIATAVLFTTILGAGAVVVHADRQPARPGAAKVLDLGKGQRGRRVAWSPDGKTLAVVTKVEKTFFGIDLDNRGSAIRLWDVEKGQMQQTLAESPEEWLAFGRVVFSADGKTIAAAVDERRPVMLPNGRGAMRSEQVIKIWDAKTLALMLTLDSRVYDSAFALSPDGKRLAAACFKKIELWNARSGKLEKTIETGKAQPLSLAFSPDSKVLVVGDQMDDNSGQVEFWDAQSWKVKHVLKHDTIVTPVAFSANGKVAACGTGGHDLILLCDAQKGELIRFILGRPGIRCVAFSPDGRTVAAAGKGGDNIRLWDAQTGELKETLKGHTDTIFSLAFSPDGKTLASTSQDTTVRLWPIRK